MGVTERSCYSLSNFFFLLKVKEEFKRLLYSDKVN
nr:MAG TPA: hypothetical protein [Caudoviricetes sp.]